MCQNVDLRGTVVQCGAGRSKGIVLDAYVPLMMHRTRQISILYRGLPASAGEKYALRWLHASEPRTQATMPARATVPALKYAKQGYVMPGGQAATAALRLNYQL